MGSSVFVAACGMFNWGMQGLLVVACESSFLTRDRTVVPCTGSLKS